MAARAQRFSFSRKRVYEILERGALNDRVDDVVHFALIGLILVNVGAVILESVPAWDAAYAGPKDLSIPEDFLAALEAEPRAKATFATLNRQNLYAIYHRLQTAKRPETRAKRLAAMVTALAEGKRFH